MSEHPRRAFIRQIGRALLGAALIGGAAALVARNGDDCINRGVCRGCAAFRDCGLPQALSAKQAGVNEETWRTTQNQ